MVRFSFDRWPLVVAHHPASHTPEAFDAYLRSLERLVATGGPYAFVDVFPPGATVPDMKLLRKFARWFEAHRVRSKAACVASASVVPSAPVRGAARFLQTIVDMDEAVFSASLAEAIAYCEGALRARGIELGTELAPAALTSEPA